MMHFSIKGSGRDFTERLRGHHSGIQSHGTHGQTPQKNRQILVSVCIPWPVTWCFIISKIVEKIIGFHPFLSAMNSGNRTPTPPPAPRRTEAQVAGHRGHRGHRGRGRRVVLRRGGGSRAWKRNEVRTAKELSWWMGITVDGFIWGPMTVDGCIT